MVSRGLRYQVEVHEGAWVGILAQFASDLEAQQWALKQWDDALPHNTVHVRDMQTSLEIGRVCHAGDGSPTWEKAREKPMTAQERAEQMDELERETIG